MPKPEATVEGILTVIGKKADLEMRRFADAIERRELHTFIKLSENVYGLVLLLRQLDDEFELPVEWPPAINDLWNEMETLRHMSRELMRAARFEP